MTREAEGVEHSQYSGEGSLCWLGLTEPPSLGATPGARRGRPRGCGAGERVWLDEIPQ